MAIYPDRDGVAVKANMGGSTSPIGLEGKADSLMLGEVREAAPLLEEEAEGILDATTNPEGGQGKSPEVSLAFGLFASSPVFHTLTGLSLCFTHLHGRDLPQKGKQGTARSLKKILKSSTNL